MEARGLTLDVALRDKLRVETAARVNVLTATVENLAKVFHHTRIARWQDITGALEEIAQHELETHPLFGMDESSGLAPCDAHPEYRGITKRAKCAACAAIYAGAASLRAKIRDLRGRSTKARAKAKILTEKGFQTTSDAHWREFLFDKEIGLGLEASAFTDKKKEPKVDDGAIEELQRRYTDVEVLALRVELQRLLRRQRVVLALEADDDRRIYFSFSLHRTATGRSSSGGDTTDDDKLRGSGGGNGQNWRDEDRRLIVASTPDRVLAEADFSQIELRVMAWLAKERRLLEALKAGVDVHSLNAAAFFGCDPSQARVHRVWLEGRWQEARQGGKKGSHMMNYHCGAEKLGATMQPWYRKAREEMMEFVRLRENEQIVFEVLRRARRCAMVSRMKAALERAPDAIIERCANAATAAGWIEAYFEKWPGLRVYQEEQIARATAQRYLIGTGGRRIDFYNWRYINGQRILADAEEAVAFDPQWTTAMIAIGTIPAMEAAARLWGGELLLFVHDSYLVELPKDRVELWWDTARDELEHSWPQLGPSAIEGEFSCPAEMKTGRNWGKASEANPEGLR